MEGCERLAAARLGIASRVRHALDHHLRAHEEHVGVVLTALGMDEGAVPGPGAHCLEEEHPCYMYVLKGIHSGRRTCG